MKRRGELRLIRQAINNDWDTPPEQREKAMRFIESVLKDPAATQRELMAACRCCVAAGWANLRERERQLRERLRGFEERT